MKVTGTIAFGIPWWLTFTMAPHYCSSYGLALFWVVLSGWFILRPTLFTSQKLRSSIRFCISVSSSRKPLALAVANFLKRNAVTQGLMNKSELKFPNHCRCLTHLHRRLSGRILLQTWFIHSYAYWWIHWRGVPRGALLRQGHSCTGKLSSWNIFQCTRTKKYSWMYKLHTRPLL